jgi:hypothetical protein
MSTQQFQIEYRNPRDLIPYANNTRKHSQEQVAKLAGAIAEFDFDQPIVVDGKGVIIKGHGRQESALRLGLKQVPVIVRNDLTAAQVKAARLADNRIAADGRDDYEAIAVELEALAELNFDLKYTGFDPAELDKFLDGTQIDFQAPQVFGSNENWQVVEGGKEAIAQALGDATAAQGEEDNSDSDAPKHETPQDKYPLAIVLNSTQAAAWKAYKESIGVKRDTEAFLTVLEQL